MCHRLVVEWPVAPRAWLARAVACAALAPASYVAVQGCSGTVTGELEAPHARARDAAYEGAAGDTGPDRRDSGPEDRPQEDAAGQEAVELVVRGNTTVIRTRDGAFWAWGRQAHLGAGPVNPATPFRLSCHGEPAAADCAGGPQRRKPGGERLRSQLRAGCRAGLLLGWERASPAWHRCCVGVRGGKVQDGCGQGPASRAGIIHRHQRRGVPHGRVACVGARVDLGCSR